MSYVRRILWRLAPSKHPLLTDEIARDTLGLFAEKEREEEDTIVRLRANEDKEITIGEAKRPLPIDVTPRLSTAFAI